VSNSPGDIPDPDRKARERHARRRDVHNLVAWSRHAKARAAQKVSGRSCRQYNKLEAEFARMLEAAGVDYRWQFPLGRYVYDFLLPNHLLVEVHGEYWHADPERHDLKRLTPDQRRNVLNDIDKKLFAAGQGYRLKVVWESDIRSRKLALDELLDTGLPDA
jgi:G:T-mismatch repair DNA endonuclease (very short patch repair protein)